MSRDNKDDIGFSEDSRIVVRIRENGTSGPLQAKFVATVEEIKEEAILGSRISLSPPWDRTVQLRPHEAEFEPLEEDEEVTF